MFVCGVCCVIAFAPRRFKFAVNLPAACSAAAARSHPANGVCRNTDAVIIYNTVPPCTIHHHQPSCRYYIESMLLLQHKSFTSLEYLVSLQPHQPQPPSCPRKHHERQHKPARPNQHADTHIINCNTATALTLQQKLRLQS